MNPQAVAKFPAEFDGMLGWPKPSWGDWEVRPIYVIDVHRIPSLAPGYCYGKRIMYIDKQYFQTMSEDLYDSNNKLWKVVWMGLAPGQFTHYGEQMGFDGIIEVYWDVQNDHVSYVTSIGPSAKPFAWNEQVPARYQNVQKYSSPGGLMQLMR
jgi:hypothetical protein